MTPRHDLYVGCDVVCVRAEYDPAQRDSIASGLVEGQVYRIRWLGMYNHYLDGEYLGVRVEGIDRGTCPHWGYEDPPFNANRFRPVVKDPTAIFKRIATDPSWEIDAPEGPRRERVPDERKEEEVV